MRGRPSQDERPGRAMQGADFFVGIDAAAHATTAAVADSHGLVRSVAKGPGVSPGRINAADHQRLLHQVVEETMARARVDRSRMTAVAVGMSGAETPSGKRRIEAWVNRVLAPVRCMTECPAILSLRAATRDAVGVGLVVNQRTSCVGRDRYGRRHAVGGHGAVSGDVGNTDDLAMRVLGAAWMADDGRAGPSSLSTAIPRAVGVDSVQRLPEILERGELSASVAEAVIACLFAEAESGDGLAEKIIEDTGSRLGASAVAGMRALNLRAANAVVVLDGAMFTRPTHQRLVEATQKRIISAVNEAHVIVANTPRVLGAVLFARDLMDHAPLAFADRVRGQAQAVARAPR
ncbi:MAG: BadF/BadG/BcrA/BcrD ATPase family protein [Myxococcota bacterium]